MEKTKEEQQEEHGSIKWKEREPVWRGGEEWRPEEDGLNEST